MLKLAALASAIPQLLLLIIALASHSFVFPSFEAALESLGPSEMESLKSALPVSVAFSMHDLHASLFSWWFLKIPVVVGFLVVAGVVSAMRLGIEVPLTVGLGILGLVSLVALVDLAAQLLAMTILLPNLLVAP